MRSGSTEGLWIARVSGARLGRTMDAVTPAAGPGAVGCAAPPTLRPSRPGTARSPKRRRSHALPREVDDLARARLPRRHDADGRPPEILARARRMRLPLGERLGRELHAADAGLGVPWRRRAAAMLRPQPEPWEVLGLELGAQPAAEPTVRRGPRRRRRGLHARGGEQAGVRLARSGHAQRDVERDLLLRLVVGESRFR